MESPGRTAAWKIGSGSHLDATRICSSCPAASVEANVQEFVRHIWGVDCAGASARRPARDARKMPRPLDALFVCTPGWSLPGLLTSGQSWESRTFSTWTGCPEARTVSRRKCGHALFHSQRHWAQLATLVRNAGFPRSSGRPALQPCTAVASGARPYPVSGSRSGTAPACPGWA